MTLSYNVVCALLNFLIGFLSIMLFVQSCTKDKKPHYIVVGTAIYLAIVTFFCVTTTGWQALLASIVGSCGIFWLGEPKDICRMWGRAIGRFADKPYIRRRESLHYRLHAISDALRIY